MKPNTCLVIDTWEGQLEIDESVLKANGVAGMAIRLNDMNGGHHMDTGFWKQWGEAVNFVRFPYFVYNPWVNGKANFDWLKSNIPTDCKFVAIDLEVRYSGYSSITYANEVAAFLELCKPFWKTILYTGQGYLDIMSKWPSGDYWWAQYVNPTYYFTGVTTWEQLKIKLDLLDKPFNVNFVPGNLKMWQFSGDYLVLPGNPRKMDVNIFYGTPEELANYVGGITITMTDTVKIMVSALNIRADAGIQYAKIGTLSYGASVSILEYKKISNTEVWGRISNGWICLLLGTSIFTTKTDFSSIPVFTTPPPVVVDPGAVVIPDGRMATVIVNTLNIRSGHDTSFSVVGTLKLNDTIKIISRVSDSAGNMWGNIGTDKWICTLYSGVAYVSYGTITTVAPPYVKTFTVPRTGSFLQSLHDYERSDWGFKPRSISLNYKDGGINALPETVPLLNHKNDFYPLSKEWQFFWFELLKKAAGGQLTNDQLLAKWKSLTADRRAFTDYHAVENGYCDYVLGINLGAKPICIKALTTGGNLSKVLVDNGTLLTIECFNVTLPPPNIDDVWEKQPWLYQWATQETTVQLSNNTYKVIPFPQLNPYNGSPIPVVSLDGTQIISKSNSRIVNNGKTYNIYNGY